MLHSIDVPELMLLSGAALRAEIVDVRAAARVDAHPVTIPGALVRDLDAAHAWAMQLDDWRPVVVYCAEGHGRGRDACAALRAAGRDARWLAGGLAAWEEAGAPVAPLRAKTRWVTRERPKIDRIACPWLIRRFIDPDAAFDYVPTGDVLRHADATGATPFDVPGVTYTHAGDRCSFDAFVDRHGLDEPALSRLASIVRAADTGYLDAAPEAPGLLALSLGLSRTFRDDHAMMRAGMLMYDALYAWARDATGDTHAGRPASHAGPA